MPTTAVLAPLTMPYENFMNELATSIQVYGTAIATIVLIVCAFGYMGAEGTEDHRDDCDSWRCRESNDT